MKIDLFLKKKNYQTVSSIYYSRVSVSCKLQHNLLDLLLLQKYATSFCHLDPPLLFCLSIGVPYLSHDSYPTLPLVSFCPLQICFLEIVS